MREHLWSNGTADRTHSRVRLLTTFLLVASVAACGGDSTGVNASANQISFSAGGSVATGTTQGAVLPLTSNGHTLDLSQITVTVRNVELKRETEDDCDNSGPGKDETCAELKVGGATVDLPTDGSAVTIPADALPAGTFHELEVHVSSVRLRGTFDSVTFDVTLPLSVKSEIEFEPALVITDGTPTTIALNLPVADWFKNADGSIVNPSDIASSPTLLTQLQARISASLRAFEDRDHDGHDDHGGDRGGNRGPG